MRPKSSRLCHSSSAPHADLGQGQEPLGSPRLEAPEAEAEAGRAALVESSTACLARLTQEVRATLSAIMGFSEFLLDPDQPHADRIECVRAIRKRGHGLSRLASDALDYVTLQTQGLELESGSVTLPDLLARLGAGWDQLARDKGLSFRMGTSVELPAQIATDPARLRQVLTSVVEFAVASTERGGIEVTVRLAAAEGTAPSCLEFVVKDSGPGYSAAQAACLFEPFAQADDLPGDQGAGRFSLALAARLARALGGGLELLETEPGRGSQFRIRVSVGHPALLAPAATMEARGSWREPKAAVQRRALEGVFVLIVDDTPMSQLTLSRLLRQAGAEVRVASNGIEGVELALAGSWDVILMATQLSGGPSGLESARHLRARGYEGPIIALSSRSLLTERRRILASGFDSCLVQPLDRLTLLDTVVEQLHRGRRVGRAPADERPPRELLN